ncbi:MAG: hypothetical protein LBL83_11960 [Clostridiales bacterium]|jgi:hypothetical protein|nr:hypothetical protein [Clostridiales bacterium]
MNDGTLSGLRFAKCPYERLKARIASYYKENGILVDASWELCVWESDFYAIEDPRGVAGYFALHRGGLLVLFHVDEAHGRLSQEIFADIRKRKSVKEALIPTGDEFFLSHALDGYSRIETESYLSVYSGARPQDPPQGLLAQPPQAMPQYLSSHLPQPTPHLPPPQALPRDLPAVALRLADVDAEEDRALLGLCGDFFKYELEHPEVAKSCEEIYAIRDARDAREARDAGDVEGGGGPVVGFGVIDYQRVVDAYASLGMIIREGYRRRRYGTSALLRLREIAAGKGYVPVSECKCGNRNSKMLMESAGASVKSRLLRFYF